MKASDPIPNKRLAVTATIVSIAVGGVALWNQFKPDEELPDLSGIWTLTNTVRTSNLERYIGEVYEFELYVTQEGEKLSGEGEQTRYNGKVAPSHFPIRITEGTLHDGKVVLRYVVNGTRAASGLFTLALDPDDPTRLSGTFASAAADTKGSTTASIDGGQR